MLNTCRIAELPKLPTEGKLQILDIAKNNIGTQLQLEQNLFLSQIGDKFHLSQTHNLRCISLFVCTA